MVDKVALAKTGLKLATKGKKPKGQETGKQKVGHILVPGLTGKADISSPVKTHSIIMLPLLIDMVVKNSM